MQQIYCAIDVPAEFKDKALYGIRMLLLPFRIEPVFVDRVALKGCSIYYGSDTSDLSPDTLHIGWVTQTIQFFAQSEPKPLVSRYLRVADHRIPVLFEATGDLSYDPVATVVYYLSGWQEVHTTATDEHGRFAYEHSIQHELGTADQPTVDWYRHLLAELLRKKGLHLERKEWGGKSWVFCPTHDIDYDKKWRPGIYKRELLDRAVLNSERESVFQRVDRAFEAAKSMFHDEDPFRHAFVRMRDEVARRGWRATYFMKSGGSGLRDVAYSLTDSFVFQQLTELNRNKFEIGHHPSYHSFLSIDKLHSEKATLEAVCGFPIQSHRAHYLRYSHPSSAHQIQASGFSIDSTLGFATRCGFRHATCLPFLLYDPLQDIELGVMEMPLVCMESALFNRMNLNLEQAQLATHDMMETCAQFGGAFIALWHNTLWDESDYPGWGDHFISTLSEAKRMEAEVETLQNAIKSWK